MATSFGNSNDSLEDGHTKIGAYYIYTPTWGVLIYSMICVNYRKALF